MLANALNYMAQPFNPGEKDELRMTGSAKNAKTPHAIHERG
jgi:hypothetical protein